jgi:hypothetical protein
MASNITPLTQFKDIQQALDLLLGDNGNDNDDILFHEMVYGEPLHTKKPSIPTNGSIGMIMYKKYMLHVQTRFIFVITCLKQHSTCTLRPHIITTPFCAHVAGSGSTLNKAGSIQKGPSLVKPGSCTRPVEILLAPFWNLFIMINNNSTVPINRTNNMVKNDALC